MPDEISVEDNQENHENHDYDNNQEQQSQEIPAEIGTGQSDFEEEGDEDETEDQTAKVEDDNMYSSGKKDSKLT